MSDTPTLLANASAGQLLDDAKWAEGMAALDIGTRIIVRGPDSPDRASLLRLAELARAVAALEAAGPSRGLVRWSVQPGGRLTWRFTHPDEQGITLCAALASTRHTQGEG